MMPVVWGALAGSGLLGISGSLSGLGDVASVLFAFFTAITDGRMWRSLGWLLLGIVLMGVGAGLWLQTA